MSHFADRWTPAILWNPVDANLHGMILEERRWIRLCLAVNLVVRAQTISCIANSLRYTQEDLAWNKEPTHHSSEVLTRTRILIDVAKIQWISKPLRCVDVYSFLLIFLILTYCCNHHKDDIRPTGWSYETQDCPLVSVIKMSRYTQKACKSDIFPLNGLRGPRDTITLTDEGYFSFLASHFAAISVCIIDLWRGLCAHGETPAGQIIPPPLPLHSSLKPSSAGLRLRRVKTECLCHVGHGVTKDKVG